MASGKQHAIASIAISAPAGLLLHNMTGSSDIAWWGVVGCWLGVVLSPDLDIAEYDKVTVPEKVMLKLPLLGPLMVRWWWLYGISIPHRHPLSHLPGLGTMFRIAYALTPVAIFISFALLVDNYTIHWLRTVVLLLWPDVVVGVVLGLLLSDTMHWFMDGRPI